MTSAPLLAARHWSKYVERIRHGWERLVALAGSIRATAPGALRLVYNGSKTPSQAGLFWGVTASLQSQPVSVTLFGEGPTVASDGSVSGRPRRGAPPLPMGPLRALQLIHTLGDSEPLAIVPVIQPLGTAVPPEDRMAAKVRWAERARYTVLTRNVPASFAPYNAVIRISERGTEDRQRDYLAHLVPETEALARDLPSELSREPIVRE